MAKVTYTNLKLKTNTDVQTVDVNGTKVEVKQYLPISDKYDLIMTTVQKSMENGFPNPLKLEMYFSLNVVYLYTNISFTDKQRENEEKLFDTLLCNDVFDNVMAAIPEAEYEFLENMMNSYIDSLNEYNKSVAAVINNVVHDLPTQATAAKEIMDNFDPEKFKNVIDFARAANGGRDIKLNTPIEDPTGPILAPLT